MSWCGTCCLWAISIWNQSCQKLTRIFEWDGCASLAVVVLSFGGSVELCSTGKSQLLAHTHLSQMKAHDFPTGCRLRHETSLDYRTMRRRAREVVLRPKAPLPEEKKKML